MWACRLRVYTIVLEKTHTGGYVACAYVRESVVNDSNVKCEVTDALNVGVPFTHVYHSDRDTHTRTS